MILNIRLEGIMLIGIVLLTDSANDDWTTNFIAIPYIIYLWW